MRTSAGPVRILVVDDEPFVAESTASVLCSLGYSAEGMTDPVAALERVRSAPSDVDLLLTDQMMPGVTGDLLARRVHAVRPDLPVLIMTGFSYSLRPERAAEVGVSAVLFKPIPPQDLRMAIDRATGRA